MDSQSRSRSYKRDKFEETTFGKKPPSFSDTREFADQFTNRPFVSDRFDTEVQEKEEEDKRQYYSPHSQ